MAFASPAGKNLQTIMIKNVPNIVSLLNSCEKSKQILPDFKIFVKAQVVNFAQLGQGLIYLTVEEIVFDKSEIISIGCVSGKAHATT